MNVVAIFPAILAIVRAIPVVDRWLDDAILQYKSWKLQQDNAQAAAAVKVAEEKNSATAINDLIKKDMQ